MSLIKIIHLKPRRLPKDVQEGAAKDEAPPRRPPETAATAVGTASEQRVATKSCEAEDLESRLNKSTVFGEPRRPKGDKGRWPTTEDCTPWWLTFG